MVIGNHDNPLSFGKAHALDIFQHVTNDGIYIIDRPRTITLTTRNGPVQIVGIPWPTRTTLSLKTEHLGSHPDTISQYLSDTVGHLIQQHAEQLDPTIPSILTGHLTVSSGMFSGSEKQAIYGKDPVLLPSQLAISPFDYVALGHLHRHQNLNPEGAPVVYPGSIERIDFGERSEQKGFCYVSIADDKTTHYTFEPVPARPFLQIEIHLTEQTQQTQRICETLATYDLTDAVVKIRYHIHEGIQDRVDISAVERACVKAHYIMGIFPVHTVQPRKRRAGYSVEMQLPDLLEQYFSNTPSTQKSAQKLTEKALQLTHYVNENT